MSQITNVNAGGVVPPISNSVTTVGAVTGDVITLDLGAVPATYAIEVRVASFNASTPAGAGYQVFGAARTTGLAATLVGVPDVIANEEAALLNADIDIVVAGNTAIVRVTGVALLTIDWVAVATYTRAT